jgi:hypothetical protein
MSGISPCFADFSIYYESRAGPYLGFSEVVRWHVTRHAPDGMGTRVTSASIGRNQGLEAMQHLQIDLDSWVIQDGNCSEFKVGREQDTPKGWGHFCHQ